LTYKRSRRFNAEIDHLAAATVRALDPDARVVEFSPYGYDERQFCSPGFNLPLGRLTRSANDTYPEYHTSADNMALMRVDALAQSICALARIVNALDRNVHLRNTSPHGEPRLGKHGLFRSTGGSGPKQFEYALLWLLNQSDGAHGVLDIAAHAGLDIEVLEQAAAALIDCGLLADADAPAGSRASALVRAGAQCAV
jgi:aminopeptidase-like protein